MFDTIAGLPVHILVIHVVVVLGPIAALMAIAYAVRPAWRARLRMPLSVLAVLTGLAGLVAGESGETLERRVKAADGSDAAAMAVLHAHTEAGDLAKVVCLAFMVVTLALVWTLLKPPAHTPNSGERAGARGPLAAVAVGALVLMSLGTLYSVTVTGHTGAKAAWADQVQGPAPTGEHDG
jgi:hypothetical protein